MSLRRRLQKLVAELDAIGDTFRRARGQESQTAFGKRLGICLNHVHYIETGQRMPSKRTIKRLSEVMSKGG